MSQATQESAYDLWDIPSFEESNKQFELIEEGNYLLKLVEVGEPQAVDPKWDPSGKKTRAQFTFEVQSDIYGDELWAGTKINTWLTISMNEKSHLYPIAKALLGGKVEPNMRIKPSMILNKVMQASVVHGEQNAKGQIWPEIKSPMAYRPRPTSVNAVMEQFDAVEETDENLKDVPF